MYKNMPMPKPFSAEIVYFCNMSIVRAKKVWDSIFCVTRILHGKLRIVYFLSPGIYWKSVRGWVYLPAIFSPIRHFRSGPSISIRNRSIICIRNYRNIRTGFYTEIFSENRYPPILSGTFLCDRQSTSQYLIANFLPDH